MQAQKIHILAVQEGRARTSRHVQHGPFDCIITAGDKGQAGVELWFHTEGLKAICGHQFQLQHDVCVWHAKPRLMAVSCQLGGLHVELVVGYAPQAGRPAAEIMAWWQEVEQILCKVSQEATIIFLGDFNCKIGSVVSEGISDFAADFEDLGGEHFRQICTKFALLVPSTWHEYHDGASDTFCGPRGFTSRLDYIAVGSKCQAGIVRTFVAADMDLLNGDKDHRPLVLDLEIEFQQCGHQGFTKKPLYNRV